MNLRPDKECENRGGIGFLIEIITDSIGWHPQ